MTDIDLDAVRAELAYCKQESPVPLDIVDELRLWVDSIDDGDGEVCGPDLAELGEICSDAAEEIDRLRDLGLRLYVALRDYRTLDPAAIGTLLREVANGSEQ